MPDPVMPPDAKANTDIETDGDDMPEGHEEFARHLDHAFANHPVLKYMMSTFESQAEGDGSGDGGVDRYHRKPAISAAAVEKMEEYDRETVLRYQRQVDELKAELALQKHEGRKLRYERSLTDLRDQEGFDIDVGVELKECVELDDGEFEKHLNRIRRIAKYARTPVGGDLPLEAIAQDNGKDPLSDPKNCEKITRYMREHKLTGDNAFYEAAKKLNYIK